MAAVAAAARSAIRQKMLLSYFMLRPARSRQFVDVEEDFIAAATAARLRERLR